MKKLKLLALACLLPLFLPAQMINRIEYWIDGDPGLGKATPVSGFTPASTVSGFAFTLPVSDTLTPGIHTLGIRSRSSNGNWSHTNLVPVYVFAPPVATRINRVEYSIDDDSGWMQLEPVGGVPAAPEVANFAFTIPANLSTGIHTLYIRSRSTDGKWSHTNCVPLYVADGDPGLITGLEFFKAGDPGYYLAEPLFGSPQALEFTGAFMPFNPAALDTGAHYIGVRSRSTRGHWSLTNFIQILVVDPTNNSSTPALLDGLRVFPNPFVEQLTLIPPDNANVRVLLYDPAGKLVWENSVSGETRLDLPGFPSGTYTALFWIDSRQIVATRLIKL